MTFQEFMYLRENYGDAKYSPKKLQKELPKGYSYGKEQQGKGDHKSATIQVKNKGKNVDTDMKIGGAHGGRDKYSPSWKATHDKHKKTLSGIDKEVSSIQKKKESGDSDTSKRMNKSYDRRVAAKGRKALADIRSNRGIGAKTNERGAGNKARRRMEGQS